MGSRFKVVGCQMTDGEMNPYFYRIERKEHKGDFNREICEIRENGTGALNRSPDHKNGTAWTQINADQKTELSLICNGICSNETASANGGWFPRLVRECGRHKLYLEMPSAIILHEKSNVSAKTH
jgi:hypothetical protein